MQVTARVYTQLQLTDQRPNGRELAARELFAASQRFV